MPQTRRFSTIPTKLLLPIDFSSSSEAALEIASDLALHFHAELYLLHVMPMFPTTSIPDLLPETEFLQEARGYQTGIFKVPRGSRIPWSQINSYRRRWK